MIRIKRNDTLPVMTATFESPPGTPMPLTGSTVRFLMAPRDGGAVKVDATATVVDAPAGKVEYAWEPADTDTAGVFKAEWEITYGDGSVLTVPTEDYLYIEIIEDID